MSKKVFKALVVEESDNGSFVRSIKKRSVSELPDGEVLIRVFYSSLNYKDALSATGNKGVTRYYPHTPGIDAAGIVKVSTDERFEEGDEVLVTGYNLGMNTSGGFGQYVRVPAAWVVPIPKGMTVSENMMYGTAGFTAALSVYRIMENGTTPDKGQVVVTGATGGVGSLSIAILSKLGYDVVAVTGKVKEHEFLTSLGASKIISREEVDDTSGKLMLSGKWAGGVDTVGGNMLSTIIKETKLWGSVAVCGNVASYELNTNVYPFILRGVTLLGIDSGNCPMPLRRQIWSKLAGEWKVDIIKEIVRECSLDNLNDEIDRILEGKQKGRVLVSLLD